MSDGQSQLSNSTSTGGAGMHFENRVQASFVVLMLTESYAPCLPSWPIIKIKLQGKYQGYDTDDVIVYAKNDSGKEAKLLGQIKLSSKITNNQDFNKTIQAAWDDFNKAGQFDRETDIIALICGPLSATDTVDVRALLKQAENSENETDFDNRVNRAKFTSDQQRRKLEVFKKSLKLANKNVALTNEQLWRFLKSFRLLIYDLDIKGVVHSLLHSLIGQYTHMDAEGLWLKLKEMVETRNENAGAITMESIPENIRSSFVKHPIEIMPINLAKVPFQSGEIDWNHIQYASELAVVNLLGAWNEKCEGDKDVIGQIAKEKFSTWITKMRETIQQPGSPITLTNGIWTVGERQKMWETLGTRLFDDQLDIFKKCALTVLGERDPQFDLRPDERYAANIHGKVLKHSQHIREGFADTIALLGNKSSALNNCSTEKPKAIAFSIVGEIFEKADWKLWGSLNSLLPLLAESSPDSFLKSVETAMSQKPCPFEELFAQEGNGVMGRNYLTGLLWSLEGLAWDERYLSRVSVILGELASRDPGGSWANRPANSLSTIFLPWFPQTMANIEKRKVAITTLKREYPEEAWKLLIKLLPNQQRSSSGSHKPHWQKIIPEDWDATVSHEQYWAQVACYADMAVDMAKNDITKLSELISYLHHLTPESFERMLDFLSSNEIINKPEDQRLPIWEGLVAFASKHRKHADADWAVKPNVVSRIASVAKNLAPKSPLNIHHRLFSKSDFDLIESIDDWDEQQKKLEVSRQQAIMEIFNIDGISSVLSFSKSVGNPENVGYSLGALAELKVDAVILPELLGPGNKNFFQLASAFALARFGRQRWDWVNNLNMTDWSPSQIGQLFAFLPFTNEIWKKVENILGSLELEYWTRVNVWPHQEKADLYFAIDKLLKFDRPNSAIYCLDTILRRKQPLDTARATKALLAALVTKETFRSMHTDDVAEIIRALQNDPTTRQEELFQVEWAYLPILNEHSGSSPKTLGKRLATDYAFFCEIIRLIFRSNKKDRSDEKPTERQRTIASNAYRLLREWRTLPGIQSLDGSFLTDQFRKWLNAVKKDCIESGHLDVALSAIGHVLIYAPPDPDGLWINRTVAEALNSKDAEAMRSGYRMGIYNSRGVHWVDPMAKPELELSSKYKKQAEDIENAGFQRFAATLRGLSDSYSNDAKRIIEEHKG